MGAPAGSGWACFVCEPAANRREDHEGGCGRRPNHRGRGHRQVEVFQEPLCANQHASTGPVTVRAIDSKQAGAGGGGCRGRETLSHVERAV